MSDKFNIFFISDTHFNHKQILGYGREQFNSIEDMNKLMIDNWNNVVRPNDIVIHCGDVFMRTKVDLMKKVLDKLNGTKILVKGNHDVSHRKMIRAGFSMSVDRLMLVIGGKLVEVSHFPFKPKLKTRFIKFLKSIFNKKLRHQLKHFKKRPVDRGNLLICGHTHQTKNIWNGNPRMFNVGVDANKFTPVHMKRIESWVSKVSQGKYNGI